MHLESQASGVTPSATAVEEKQAILLDLAAKIDRDNDFSDTGVCANCNNQPPKGTELKWCVRCHITRYCSIDCHAKTGGCINLPALSSRSGLQQRHSCLATQFKSFFCIYIIS